VGAAGEGTNVLARGKRWGCPGMEEKKLGKG